MLTPEEIQAHEFLVSLRGYDRDEVHSFLEQVAGQIRDLRSRLESLESAQPPVVQPPEEVRAPEPAPSLRVAADPKPFFDDLGQTTQRIVEAAYESAAEIQRRARGRADRELDEARSQAAKLVAEGERRREVIEGLVEILEERRTVLAEDLRGIARAVDQMLTDFAPRDEEQASGDLVAVTKTTSSDEAEPALVAHPGAGATKLAGVNSERSPSPHDGDPADFPLVASPSAARLA
ncbi:MAG: DivIVA domain-containing protein [Egibacteraceae bacterium]